MRQKQALSIIVPTLNEAGNIAALCDRVDAALAHEGITYEIVIIDDHSTDGTIAAARTSKVKHLNIHLKHGKPGKAYSLLQGFDVAAHPLVCMIDADLQYPPEAIAPMYELLTSRNADVVVSERYNNETNFLRKLSSRVFNLVFARLLFGIRYDTQSGLKLFRKRILRDFKLMPSPWSFDLEFLVRSLENKRKILSFPIPFSERNNGVTKVKVLQVMFELARASIMLRATTSIQQLRAGHRANSHFTHFVTASMVTLGVLMASLIAHVPHASALDLAPVVSVLPVTISVSPVTTPVTIQNNPAQMTQTAQTNQASQTTSLQSTSSPSSTAVMQSNTAPTNVSGQPASISVARQTPADTSVHAAATATKPFSDYAQGYPQAMIANNLRSNLLIIGLLALGAGTLFIALYGLNRFQRQRSTS